jgi:hypothetical protein
MRSALLYYVKAAGGETGWNAAAIARRSNVMATDVLTTLATSVRAGLADTGTVFTAAIVNEAIHAAVADLSRMIPRELVHIEVLHNRTVTAEAWTSSSNAWVTLVNKPIDPNKTIKVTNAANTVTYTEDTDYIMDFAQGRVQMLSTGTMVNGASERITYEKSLKGIDLSSLTAFIQVERVEISRGAQYQEYTTFYQWGDILWLQLPDDTQGNLSENDHVRVWYRAEHSQPGSGAGSYPAYLDDLVVQGATAYSLFSKHRELNLTAATHAASAATASAAVENNTAAGVTALVAAASAATSIEDNVAAGVSAIVNAATAAAFIENNVAAGVTALGHSNDALVIAATKIQLAEGGAGEPITLALAALTKVTTHVTTAAALVITDITNRALLNEVDTELGLAAAQAVSAGTANASVLTEVITNSAGTSAKSADDYLDTGDALITGLNAAGNVPENYAEYAKVKIAGAQAMIGEASQRNQSATVYIGEASAKIREYEAMQSQVNTEITRGLAFIREADSQIAIAGFYGIESNTFIRQGEAYIAEARGYFEASQSYATQAQSYNDQAIAYFQSGLLHATQAERYIQQAQGYVNVSNSHALQAQAYHGTVDRFNQIADRFLTDARDRYRDYWVHLTSRVETARGRSRSAARQHPE